MKAPQGTRQPHVAVHKSQGPQALAIPTCEKQRVADPWLCYTSLKGRRLGAPLSPESQAPAPSESFARFVFHFKDHGRERFGGSSPRPKRTAARLGLFRPRHSAAYRQRVLLGR